MWKQVRKRDGYMTGITQNVGEMLESKDARWLFANSEFIIMPVSYTHLDVYKRQI